jgi:ABC-type uncharacterized transport system involved in gliding motility auxiliary subunit
MNLRTSSRIALGFGIALWVSAAAMLVLVPGSGAMSIGQAIVGLGLIALYFIANKGAFGRAFSGKGTLFYGTSAALTVFLMALLTGLNYVSVKKKVTWDLTQGGIFTLAEETKSLLRSLEDEIHVTAFYAPQEPAYEGARELLERYQRETELLTLEFVEPDKSPQLVQEKNITAQGPRVIFTRGQAEARAAEPSEEGFTNALRKLLHTSTSTIYFTAGHGEGALDDTTGERAFGSIVQRMEREGLRAKALHLSSGAVPADAAAVAILGPQRPFFPEEVESLRSWLDEGGRLLIALEPGFEDPALEELLADHGILFEQALVVDPLSKLMGGGDAIPVVQTYAEHEITRNFGYQTVFPTARPLTARGDVEPRPLILATTNPSAWGELDWQSGTAQFDPETERRGALGLVAATQQAVEGGERRLLAFGDADFASNRFVQAGGNADFFLNSLNWLTSREERITIRPKQRQASSLVLTEADAKFLNFFSISALPMLVLALGLSVWLVRRSK